MLEKNHVLSQKHYLLRKKVDSYFIPFSQRVEKFILISIIFLFFLTCLAQYYIHVNQENHYLVNKTIRYEGVFFTEPIDAKATLQPYK